MAMTMKVAKKSLLAIPLHRQSRLSAIQANQFRKRFPSTTQRICRTVLGAQFALKRRGKNTHTEDREGIYYKSYGVDGLEEDQGTAIVMGDNWSGRTCVKQKGVDNGWVVGQVVEGIEVLGYTDIVLTTDGEPASMQVAKQVEAVRKHQSTPQ